MIVIELSSDSTLLLGQLARRMLEIAPGVFVGNVSKRALEVIWHAIEHARPGHAVLVYPAKNELGIDFKTIGQTRYQIEMNDGVPLVRFVGRQTGAVTGVA